MQSSFLGGVPEGPVTQEALPLSLADAVARGLKQNLGVVLSEASQRTAVGARWQALSGLLPTVSLRLSYAREELNLQEFGFPVAPGESPIIGPFNVAALHLTATQPLIDYTAIQDAKAGSRAAAAAKHTFRDAREMVVFMISSLYLQAVTVASRIEAAQAQLRTAQVLYDHAVNLKQAGVVAGIEVLRSQVQLQAQQLRVIFYENEFAKAKLTLQRATGIPLAQQVQLTDEVPYLRLEELPLDDLLERAFESREDLQAALAEVKAAQASRQAAIGQWLPSIRVSADLGRSSNAWNSLLGTHAVSVTATVPVFQGGRPRGRFMQADARLHQMQARLADLRAQIEYEVRSALLDVQAADRRVEVAKSAVDLADQQVAQALDRFTAGVTSNIEVVQAQEALATATDNHLSALYAHNLARISLARAIGLSEERLDRSSGGA